MACLLTLPGSTTRLDPPRRAAPERPRPGAGGIAARAALVLLAWVSSGAADAQSPDLLPPERAFSLSARPLDAATVEARFAIADGYYLYRDKLKLTLEPGVLAAAPVLPPGKVKDDEFFGKVETYRGKLALRLSLAAPAPGTTVTLRAESQGCADAGVCYPPQVQKIALALPAAGAGPGPVVEFAPAKKSWFK
jgi:thioredoxin:protein disulfide reductase